MKSVEINLNGNKIEAELRELSPLLRIEISQLYSDYKQKANQLTYELILKNELEDFLSFDEAVEFSKFIVLNAENLNLAKKGTVPPSKQKELSAITETVKPIIEKIRAGAWKEIEDEYMIDKLKLVIKKDNISKELADMLELPANDNAWASQSLEVLKKVSDFFRGKREKPTN